MRILFLSQLVPYPLDAGAKIRSYHVLQYLAAAGHEVTLVAFARPDDRPAALAHLRQFCAAVHTVIMPRGGGRDLFHFGRSLLTGTPFLIARDHVPAMHDLLRQLMTGGNFDAVHADQLWMAPYAQAARSFAGAAQPRIVLDQHNAVFLIPERLASGGGRLRRILLGREGRRLARYEADICGRFDHVVWVTAADQAALRRLRPDGWPNTAERVIPICLDTAARAPLTRPAQPRRVTFLGGLHWPPNAAGITWFAREVWPRIVAAVPEALLTVIGKQPPAALTGDRPVNNLEVTGYVADAEPFLRGTGAFIVPLHAGGGMRVKILDAWAWGVPVVATTIGAEGLRCRHEHDILIADDPAAFAAAVIRLLQEPALGARLVENGRRTVTTHYDWRRVYPAWAALYPPPGISHE